MNLQTTLRSEQTIANVTTKGLLAAVNFHMRIQCTLHCETFTAMIALVRSFASMRPYVSYKIARFAKCFRTIFTFIDVLFRLLLFYASLDNKFIGNTFNSISICKYNIFFFYFLTYIYLIHDLFLRYRV